jgi:hypothetical protein
MNLPNFGNWQRSKPEEIKSWRSRADGLSIATEDFYAAVEKELAARQVPGLELSRVRFSEGVLLSGEREYLRMRRERLIFDVGAGMFGTDWFCSCRFAQIPFRLHAWEVLLVLLLLISIVIGYTELFGIVFGIGFFLTTAIGIVLLTRNASALGLRDFDAWLLQVPVLGAIYEGLIRNNESYYLEDARAMYVDTVDAVVRKVVNAMTSGQGVQQIEFVDSKPDTHKVLSDLLTRSQPAPAPRANRAKKA